MSFVSVANKIEENIKVFENHVGQLGEKKYQVMKYLGTVVPYKIIYSLGISEKTFIEKIRNNPYFIELLPTFYITEKLCWISLRNNHLSIKSIPRNKQTEKMCEFAIQKDSGNYLFCHYKTMDMNKKLKKARTVCPLAILKADAEVLNFLISKHVLTAKHFFQLFYSSDFPESINENILERMNLSSTSLILLQQDSLFIQQNYIYPSERVNSKRLYRWITSHRNYKNNAATLIHTVLQAHK